jgi:hypothetical protein
MNAARRRYRVGEKVGTKFAQTDGVLCHGDRKMVVTMPSVDAQIAKLRSDKAKMKVFKDEHQREGNARLALGAEWKLRVNKREWDRLEASKGITGELERQSLEKRAREAKAVRRYRYEVVIGRNKRADGTWKVEGRDRGPAYKVMQMLPDNDSQEVVTATGRVNNPKFRIATLNCFSQELLKRQRDLFLYCPRHVLNWTFRRRNLLEEVCSYDADIVCLQGVDEYQTWWQPEMSKRGYDGLFKKRTDSRLSHGVATFYKRRLYQLFRSDSVEFQELEEAAAREEGAAEAAPPPDAATPTASRGASRRSAATAAGDAYKVDGSPLRSSDVALLCTLQPWEASPHPSAVLVVNAALAPKPSDGSEYDPKAWLRMLQARMLLRRVEAFNAHMQLPVVLAGSLHVDASDPLYHMMTHGSMPKVREPPGRPGRPEASRPTWASMWVKWEVPAKEGSSPIVGYKVQRRVGQSTAVGFGSEVFVPACENADADAETTGSSSEEEEVEADSKVEQLRKAYDAQPLPRPKAAAFVALRREELRVARAGADEAARRLAREQALLSAAEEGAEADAARARVEDLDMALKVARSKLKTAGDALEKAERGDPVSMAEKIVAMSRTIAKLSSDPRKKGVKQQWVRDLDETKAQLTALENFMEKDTKRAEAELEEKAREEERILREGDEGLRELRRAERKKRAEKRRQKEADRRARRRRRAKRAPKKRFCEFNATGLAAGLCYEFRVAGMSATGTGGWSEPSAPLSTTISARQKKGLCTLLTGITPQDMAERHLRLENAAEAQEIDMDLLTGPRATGLTPRRETGERIDAVAVERSRDLQKYFARKGVPLGRRDPLSVHSLGLRSAYALYPNGEDEFSVGEPRATLVTERRTELGDYILFTGERLGVKRLMTVPDRRDACMRDVDVREPELRTESERPADWGDEPKYVVEPNYDTGLMEEVPNPRYRGEWKPTLVPNPKRTHSFLPNRTFSSTHHALCAELQFKDMNLSSEWF